MHAETPKRISGRISSSEFASPNFYATTGERAFGCFHGELNVFKLACILGELYMCLNLHAAALRRVLETSNACCC